jgi:hypothetical protein
MNKFLGRFLLEVSLLNAITAASSVISEGPIYLLASPVNEQNQKLALSLILSTWYYLSLLR